MPEWDNTEYQEHLSSVEQTIKKQPANNKFKTTPLHEWHVETGANMADFGGYHMPLWYETGVKKEHLSVLNSVGIFDTSHMACITVKGSDAFKLLQFCFTRNIQSLRIGRCAYGAFLNDKGYSIDDALIYKFSEDVFMICVNSGMGHIVCNHLIENKVANKQNLSVEIIDLSGRIAKMDIQGKNSARILASVLKNPDEIFQEMPYFSFKNVDLLDGTNILLSRSGYTGEFGFEIFISPYGIIKLWKDILKAGKNFNILPCGLGARDSLRAGAVLPLSHQDIGNSEFINHPWDFALPYNEDKTDFTKNFLGKDKLTNKIEKHIYPFAGENLRKVGTSQDAMVLDEKQNNIGTVLTCATDMGIGWHNDKIFSIASTDLPKNVILKGLSCGFVMVSKKLEYGTKLKLKEGKRTINVTIMHDVRPDRTARKAITNFYN
ncbi:MAG: aminomethyltransferase family protein [Desulfobacteraceae bacterium]|nr:aminomethyltransferase family protein [Desulfobacteraceae bacterium]